MSTGTMQNDSTKKEAMYALNPKPTFLKPPETLNRKPTFLRPLETVNRKPMFLVRPLESPSETMARAEHYFPSSRTCSGEAQPKLLL